jgi:hypothetical protein
MKRYDFLFDKSRPTAVTEAQLADDRLTPLKQSVRCKRGL